ncbi:hypothetical protein ES705_10211 [subsurface metagenome]
MINDIHKRVMELWILSKEKDEELNPSRLIYEQLTGQTANFNSEPKNAIELCEKINEINGDEPLSEKDKVDLGTYGAILFADKEKFVKKALYQASFFKIFNWIGYIFGIISIVIGEFSWWIIGFLIGTFWANGAAKLAAQKQRSNPGPAWEMPVHIAVHLLAWLGLIIFSVINLLA